MAKKYTVQYVSGATGYGWEKEFDRLDEFEGFINEMRKDCTAKVTVWDNTLQDFVFWKNALTFNVKIDMLQDYLRDMRTTTRKMMEAQNV